MEERDTSFLATLKEKVGQPIVPNLVGLDASFSLRFPDLAKEVFVSIKKGVLTEASEAKDIKGDFTFVLSSDTMGRLMTNELRPQEAFFERKVEIEGSVEKALALAPIFDEFFRSLEHK